MITSAKNNLRGRVYNLGDGALVCTSSGRFVKLASITSSGRFVKLASIGLRQFGFEAIKIDRNKFAQLLRQHRKTERNPNASSEMESCLPPQSEHLES